MKNRNINVISNEDINLEEITKTKNINFSLFWIVNLQLRQQFENEMTELYGQIKNITDEN